MNYKRITTLDGMRVILVVMKDAPTVTVLTMVEAGSKYETKEKNGLSHFLEHMCFKGTPTRPTALHLSQELDSIGSHYNAFTSEEYTGYYAKAAAKHALKLIDVIADIYLNPVFDENEIKKEKGVIVEEINMYRDLPHRHVQELFTSLMYGDQPAGWGIAGTKETVMAMRREDFVEYQRKQYVASATTVVVAGNFDEAEVLKTIENKFGGISREKKSEKIAVIENQNRAGILVENRPTDQSHLVLGVRGFGVRDPRNPVVRVASAILGAGMSSRLFQKLREEMGVGYYVRSSYDTYTDHGILSVSVGADITRVREVVVAIMDEFRKLRDTLVSKEELEKTQEYLIGTMYLGLESSDAIAEFFGYQEVLQRPIKSAEDIVAEIRAVTPEHIRDIARLIFVSEKLNLALVGPLADPESLRDTLAF